MGKVGGGEAGGARRGRERGKGPTGLTHLRFVSSFEIRRIVCGQKQVINLGTAGKEGLVCYY